MLNLFLNNFFSNKSIFKSLSILLIFSLCTTSFANQCPTLIEAGYTMTDQRTRELMRNHWLDATKSLSKSEIISRIQSFIDDSNPVADNSIAEEIYKVSKAVRIDPFVFASLIKKESRFIDDIISRNGVGLTQVTTFGLQEIKNQFGVGDIHFQADAKIVFFHLADRYLGSPLEAEAFVNWLSTSNRRSLSENIPYALLVGSLILKVKLTIYRGNYRQSLEAYNSTDIKESYAQSIISNAETFVQTSHKCQESSPKTQSILIESCHLSKDQNLCNSTFNSIST